jgi:hypothetical protein
LAFDFWNEGRPLEGKRIAEGKMNCWRESAGGRLLKGENESKGGFPKGKKLLKDNC